MLRMRGVVGSSGNAQKLVDLALNALMKKIRAKPMATRTKVIPF